MPSQKLRVVFMGTPDFAVPPLRAIIEAGHDVVAVYSQPPRPKGRGQHVQKSPVHECADEHGIPVFTPKSLKKDEDARAAFAAHDADVAIVAAYGLILPSDVLSAPKYGCLNIHASLLPRWRGASPIQHAVWMGDSESGVTIMQMEEGLDTGPMIVKGQIPITAQTTSATLHDALSAQGADLITSVLDGIAREGKPQAQAQDDAIATYAGILTRDHGRVDWGKSANEIDRQIRALNPWPGVWTEYEGKRVKIIEAEIMEGRGAPGTLVNRSGIVACGEGALKLIRVQPENAKAMDVASAVNGHYLAEGGKFT